MLILLALALLATAASGSDGQTPAPQVPAVRAATDVDRELRACIDDLCVSSDLVVEGEVLEWHRIPIPGLSGSERSRVWGVLHVTHHIWGYDSHESLAILVPATPLVDTRANVGTTRGVWFLEEDSNPWPTDSPTSERVLAEAACGTNIWSVFPRAKLGCAVVGPDGKLTVRRAERILGRPSSAETPRKSWPIDHDLLVSTIGQAITAFPCLITATLLSTGPSGPPSVVPMLCLHPDGSYMWNGKQQQPLKTVALTEISDALRENQFELLPRHICQGGPDSGWVTIEVREARGARKVRWEGQPSTAVERDYDARIRRIIATLPHARELSFR